MPIKPIGKETKKVTIKPVLDALVAYKLENGVPALTLNYHLDIDGERVEKTPITMDAREASVAFPGGLPILNPKTGKQVSVITPDELFGLVYSMMSNLIEFENLTPDIPPPPDDTAPTPG